jgi:3',5'-cyclic AMP phosphodiesterase CpdA
MIIAQISDSHIVPGDDSADPQDAAAIQLRRAVDHIMRLPARPDVVLITGDCVNGGSMPEYQRFRRLIEPLTMPVYIIPGNHDDRVQLQALFGSQGSAPLAGFVQYVVDTWPVRLIALDTNVPGKGEGYLCAERLAWLEQRLAEAPGRPTLLFMHHPPFPTGLAPFDQNRADQRRYVGRADCPPSPGRADRGRACPFDHAAALPRHNRHDLFSYIPADFPRSPPARALIGDRGTAGVPGACVA